MQIKKPLIRLIVGSLVIGTSILAIAHEKNVSTLELNLPNNTMGAEDLQEYSQQSPNETESVDLKISDEDYEIEIQTFEDGPVNKEILEEYGVEHIYTEVDDVEGRINRRNENLEKAKEIKLISEDETYTTPITMEKLSEMILPLQKYVEKETKIKTEIKYKYTEDKSNPLSDNVVNAIKTGWFKPDVNPEDIVTIKTLIESIQGGTRIGKADITFMQSKITELGIPKELNQKEVAIFLAEMAKYECET